MDSHRFVFIGGLHRSGTSLLFQCLRHHPHISSFANTGVPEDEGQHLQTVYRPAYQEGGPGRFGFRPAMHLTETSSIATPENASRLFSEWRPHWDLRKPVLLEKTPQNLIQTRFLQALFPQADFVMMMRHPVAVSYATQRWNRTSLFSLLRHWCHCHELFEQDRPYLKRILVVRYEDFVADPIRQLESVYRFLDLPPCFDETPAGRGFNKRYFAKWQAAKKGLISRHYLKQIETRLEKSVNRFGYSLRHLDMGSSDVGAVEAVPDTHPVGNTILHVHSAAAVVRGAAFRRYKSLRNALAGRGATMLSRRSAVQTTTDSRNR